MAERQDEEEERQEEGSQGDKEQALESGATAATMTPMAKTKEATWKEVEEFAEISKEISKIQWSVAAHLHASSQKCG